MEFGDRIRLLRRARKLSQEGLAREAHVSASLVNQMERGIIVDPHVSTLVRLAAVLDVPASELLGKEPTLSGKVESRSQLEGDEERRAREQTLVFYLNVLAERFEDYLAGIERGEYAPGEPRHEDLLAAYGYVDWSVDDSRELRGLLSPEFTATRERLWRAHRNLTQKHVDYGDPGTTQADADLRTARQPRPQDEPQEREGAEGATGTTA